MANPPVTVRAPALGSPRPPVRRAPRLDAAAAAAVDLARAAAEQEAPAGAVGEHLSATAEDDRVVTHLFACRAPGYVGWRWSVTVARASRAKVVTVDEVVLVPGPDSLLAPPWVPWSERVRPGDLGPGDVLPPPEDDPRLAPGWSGADTVVDPREDEPLRPQQWEAGIGRPRVLSAEGREEAADRWAGGEHGPDSALALAAPARCSSCGFLLVIGGPLGQAFGICANALSPSDGHAVSLAHGCGAHSQSSVEGLAVAVADTVMDSVGYDVLDLGHS